MAARSSADAICPSSRRANGSAASGWTEPDYGSDPGGMVTRAVAEAGGFRLNGAKMWITNSPIADVAVVWAKLDGDIRGFVVERGMKGSRRPRSRASSRCAPRSPARSWLDDCAGCRKPNLLPNVRGLSGPFGCLNRARYGISWGAMGAAEFCWHAARSLHDGAQAVRPSARRQPAHPGESSPTCRPRSRWACTARCAWGG